MVLKQTPDHSPDSGGGSFIGTTLAFLLGQSLGDFLPADLEEMFRTWGISMVLGLGGAGAPKLAAGNPVSVVLKFGMMKGLTGWLENSPNASEDQKHTKIRSHFHRETE